jgi:hypothetical protein
MVRPSEYPKRLITVFAIWHNLVSYRSLTAYFPRPTSKLFSILSLGLKVVAFQNDISLISYNRFIQFTCPVCFNFLTELFYPLNSFIHRTVLSTELFYPHEVIPLTIHSGNLSSFLFISPLFVSNNCLKTVVCFLLGNSPASEFYMPTFRNTLSVPSS